MVHAPLSGERERALHQCVQLKICLCVRRKCVRTHILHIVSRFNITFQIVSVIFQIVHVATVAAVQLA